MDSDKEQEPIDPAIEEAPTTVSSYKTSDLEWHLENDMSMLGMFCIPDVCNVPFPPEFVSMWQMITPVLYKKRDFSKFALGLPRGHGKTTVLKILIIFIILFTKKRFVLIVGASATLAENILSDVCDILDSPNMVNLFGNWAEGRETDRGELKKFRFRGRDIILAAAGSGSAVRGFNIKNRRPDVILCDDMQTKEEAQSETVAKKLLQWFVGTLMKAKAPDGCTYLYIGNMYRDLKIGGAHSKLFTCILRNLQKDPNWLSWIVGGILADGTALWEAVQPLKQLLKELQSDTLLGQADVFFSEVMNDPQGGGNDMLDLNLIPPYDIDEDIDIKVGSFIMIDPSLGKSKSDAQVVGEFDVYDGVPVMTKVHIRQTTAPLLVKFCLELAVRNRHPLICAESVAYQATLLQWFDYVSKQEKIEGIKFLPVAPRGRKKNSRIINYFKSLMAGTAIVAPDATAQVYAQAAAFDPMILNNADDILDTAAYSEDVVIAYPQDLMFPDIIQLNTVGGADVLEDCSPI